MPLTTLSDLERRLRKLEMLYDQDRHKISPPDRNVNTSHPLDVQIAAKAADSELLDGIDSTGFVQTSGNQTIGGVKTFSSLPTLPTGIPTANQPVRKGYADLAYLTILATAQNSDKLDGLDSTAFLQTSAWTTWSPTLVGWSSTTSVSCKYYKLGTILFFSAIISGTSNSTSTSFTLPESNTGIGVTGAMGYCVNNGSVLTVAARYGITVGSNVCNTYTDMASGGWTASGTKRVSVYGWISTN